MGSTCHAPLRLVRRRKEWPSARSHPPPRGALGLVRLGWCLSQGHHPARHWMQPLTGTLLFLLVTLTDKAGAGTSRPSCHLRSSCLGSFTFRESVSGLPTAMQGLGPCHASHPQPSQRVATRAPGTLCEEGGTRQTVLPRGAHPRVRCPSDERLVLNGRLPPVRPWFVLSHGNAPTPCATPHGRRECEYAAHGSAVLVCDLNCRTLHFDREHLDHLPQLWQLESHGFCEALGKCVSQLKSSCTLA